MSLRLKRPTKFTVNHPVEQNRKMFYFLDSESNVHVFDKLAKEFYFFESTDKIDFASTVSE
jgi:hypothetical protein